MSVCGITQFQNACSFVKMLQLYLIIKKRCSWCILDVHCFTLWLRNLFKFHKSHLAKMANSVYNQQWDLGHERMNGSITLKKQREVI